ncbi:MAG: hypothetical protein U1E65_30885 [Myxococcota bacterium]
MSQDLAENLMQIARTIPLLADFVVFDAESGATAGHWSKSGTEGRDVGPDLGLLKAAELAIEETPLGSATVTVSGKHGSLVIARVTPQYAVALRFDEILSFDWTNYYVQRALRRTLEILSAAPRF